MKKICTIYLQRNCPDETNRFGDHFLKWNGDISDFYVIESGSDHDKLSKFKDNTFHANWPDALENGLRFPRGLNYGLIELAKIRSDYEYIIISNGDTQLFDEPTVQILLEEMEKYPKMALLSPVSPGWGNDIWSTFRGRDTVAHRLFPYEFWMIRSTFIQEISQKNRNEEDPDIFNYFFDGNNFRGYDADTEIILKAYQNDWFAGITNRVKQMENEDLNEINFLAMKTESNTTARTKMFNEGMIWLKEKYGFKNKHEMRNLILYHYTNFFNNNKAMRELMI